MSEADTLHGEFHSLVRAFRAHLETISDTFPADSIPADAAWQEQRREEYRRVAAVAEQLSPEPVTVLGDVHIDHSRSVPSGATTYPEASDLRVSPAEPGPVQLRTEKPQAAAQSQALQPQAGSQYQAPSPPLPQEPRASAPLESAPDSFVNSSLPVSISSPATARSIISAASRAAAALSPEERLVRLQVIKSEVSACRLCGLCETRTQTVFARGTGSSGIVFVGEGPGADEDAQGLPFVGKAGQLLDRMIAAMGLERDDVYICNVVKCRPPDNRKPDEAEMATCRPYLTEQLDLLQPKVIVALGATAVQGLLGLTLGITRLRGQWRLYQGKIPVMPTFHPAYLLRQPSAKREVWQDLQAVLSQLGQKKPPAQSDR